MNDTSKMNADAYEYGYRLAGHPGIKRRVDKQTAKALLLNCDLVIRARCGYTIKAKSLGLGVYEVWAEEKK